MFFICTLPMPHDPLFEQRIANTLAAQGVKAEPKKMFGGVAFMVNGNMSVGITGAFMVRIAPGPSRRTDRTSRRRAHGLHG